LSLAALLLVSFVLACGGGDDGGDDEPEATPTPEPQGSGPAEQALARHVETTLMKPFLEDCSRADASRDVGKVCSVLRGEREGLRAYVLGPTFSEGQQWAIVGQSGGQWNVTNVIPITADNAGVPGIPWPLRAGVDVVVAGAGRCQTAGNGLNVREGPTLQQRAVDCVSDGTVLRLGAGPSQGDGYEWWQLQGRTGWVVSAYLRYPDAAQ
jgi:hypothetical protein